jgi:outer membrane receptor protein involved in Fe transport
VDEFFTEAKIPLVQDRTGFESLSLDLRYRYSDYDLGFSTDTWNAGGEWRPIDSLMIRGGVSQAVRAPNLIELFEPQTLGLWSGSDPCSTATPELSAAECLNTGVSGAQYGNVPKSPADQYNALFGGNPVLSPETSDSVTFGAVFTPTGGALDGLTLSVDYWSFEIEDVISAGLGEEFTIRQCASTGDPTFCSLITRGPNGNLWLGTVQGVQSTNLNIASLELNGIDLTGTYAMDIGNHGLDFAYRGTFVQTDDTTPLPGEEAIDCVGFFAGDCGRPRPEYKHTFSTSWSTPWDLGFTLGWRTVGEVTEHTQPGVDPNYKADAQHYIDLAGNYNADWFGSTTRVSFGISNVTDNSAPVSGVFNEIAVYGNGNTVPGTWDALGRYWFVGVNVAL